MDKFERAINKLLAPKLAAAGFELKKDWNGFFRFTDYGFDEFMVISKGRVDVDCFGIACAIAVRHERIQTPFNTLGFIHGEEEQRQNPTLVLGYPFYKWGTPREYLQVRLTHMAEDTAAVAVQLEEAFLEQATIFYKRFSRLSEVEELLNREPMADISPYSGGFIPEDRAVTSLLCAKAINPLRYDAVKDAFIAQDKGMYPREKRMELINRVDKMII